MKKVLSILLFSFFSFGYAQTNNQNLNQQLQLMKNHFIEGNFRAFSFYVYPKAIEKLGGVEKMIELSESSMKKIKAEGYAIIDINYKDPSDYITAGNELQMTITQELIMQTPKGKTASEYTLIGISTDNGTSWKFIDSSGKPKETMIERYPNLSSEIVINPIQRRYLED